MAGLGVKLGFPVDPKEEQYFSNLKDLSHTLLTHQRNLVYHHKKGLYQCIRHCHIGADHRGTLARLFSGLDKPRGVWLAGHNCPPETQFKKTLI